jgi:hypothetical protein
MAGVVRRGCRAYSGSVRAVREVYVNPLISPSLPSFYSPVAQPAASREFLDYFQSFHALEMATFAFKPYTYVPTAPRSKCVATRREPAPKQVGIFDKL